MTYTYFHPDWNKINALLQQDDISDFIDEKKRLIKEIDNAIQLRFRNRELAKEATRVKEIKSLPKGATVYFIGMSKDIPFGQECKKVEDKRKRMIVSCNGKNWDCNYSLISSAPPTSEQISSYNVKKRILGQ